MDASAAYIEPDVGPITPAILVQPESLTAVEGDTVSFDVVAGPESLASTLSYQWLQDGAAIPGATSATYTVQATRGGSNPNEITALNNTFKVLYHGIGVRNDWLSGKLVAHNNIFFNGESGYWVENVDLDPGYNLVFLAPGRSVDPADCDANDVCNRDPLFVDVAGGDFHLQTGSQQSPALNAGTDVSALMGCGAACTDRDGTIRPQGGGWDMGAYEQQ